MRPLRSLLASLVTLALLSAGCGSSRKPCTAPVKTLSGR